MDGRLSIVADNARLSLAMMQRSTSQREEAFMSFQLRNTPLCLALLMAGALATPAWAATPVSPATSGTVSPTETPPKPAKTKKKSTKVKYDKGSAETTAERDRRLYRECKGRPNAGACMGYAS
jgi:hypothetical protein